MTAAWLFLAVSVYGALYTLNAYRPFRASLTIGFTFFAHWLTVELAGHHLVWQVAATLVFAQLGAFSHWPGWIGLGITVVSWTGLLGLVRASQRTEDEVEAALVEALGSGYRDEIDPSRSQGQGQGQGPSGPLSGKQGTKLPRTRLATAFYFRRGDVERVRDLRYGPYGRRNLLDVWHHREDPGTTPAPVMFWIHGGAWIVGHKAQQALPMLNHLTAAGWVCVSINYRLAPRSRWPDYLVDVKRALAWTREHIAEYGGDPEFIVVSGGSAGGHLAALTALTANDPRYQPGFEGADTSIQAAVPFYGVYDFTNRMGSRARMDAWGFRRFLAQRVMPKPFTEDAQSYTDASPLDQVRPDAPPFFVLHGSHDVLAPVADTREFVRRLRETSSEPVAFAELRGAQHAFEVFHSIRATHVIRAVERFGLWSYSRHLAQRAGTTEAPARQTG